MRDEDTLLLVALGVLLVSGKSYPAPDLGPGWVWPIPPLDAGGVLYKPTVSDGLGTARPGGRIHEGVDVMYRRRQLGDQPGWRAGSSDGTPHYFAPPMTPILAARAGAVWSVKRTARGWSVVIDHGKPWASFYQHLESTGLPEHAGGKNVATGKPTLVHAGDILGVMGWDPLDAAKLRHLHFEVWDGAPTSPVNPEPSMRHWSTVPWAFKA